MNDKLVNLSFEHLVRLLKRKLKSNIVVQNIFRDFNLSLDHLDGLSISIEEIGDRFAESDDKSMKLSKKLIRNSAEFGDIFAVVLHEIWHFAKRLHEKLGGYFGDDEELEAFSVSIAAQLSQGDDLDIIYNRLYPKVEFHYSDPIKAKEVFKKMIEKAYKLLQ